GGISPGGFLARAERRWPLRMSGRSAVADSTIVNLYYAELDRAVRFWRDGLGFAVVLDQGWAKLLRLADRSFLGLVDGSRGHLRPQPTSAVLVTLVVEDLSGWRERARTAGAAGITEIERRDDLAIERFFCRDPGGYALEFQRFLRPADREAFH
ncbi:MAG: VOC family protein, partial [Candidatus Bipolaricaulota bacterium]